MHLVAAAVQFADAMKAVNSIEVTYLKDKPSLAARASLKIN
jgi:hypothetical protein